MAIIGGADGPTSIFLAGELNMGWLNVFGLIMVILLMIPNIVYAVKYRNQSNKCTNKLMNILEQIGRYGCMFLMIFNIGISEFGFSSVEMFLVYFTGNIVLMAAYWISWILFFIKPDMKKQMALAIIPTLLFLLNGVTMRHYLLVITGVIFGIGHLYVTYENRSE